MVVSIGNGTPDPKSWEAPSDISRSGRHHKVFEYYGEHNAQWLSRLTHMEDPWNEARKGIPSGMRCANVITKESMAMYYGGL